MAVIRVGTNEKYASGWDAAFGASKSKKKTATKKKTVTAKKKATKKKPAKKAKKKKAKK